MAAKNSSTLVSANVIRSVIRIISRTNFLLIFNLIKRRYYSTMVVVGSRNVPGAKPFVHGRNRNCVDMPRSV